MFQGRPKSSRLEQQCIQPRLPGPYALYVLLPRVCTTLKIFRGGGVLLPRAGMSLNIFRSGYVLIPRAGISLNILRDRYVFLPRADITLNIFRGRYVLLPRACMPLKILACNSSRITTVIQVTVHHLSYHI